MFFKGRNTAGAQLASKLKKYKGKNSVVYALPRGGVVVGAEIARQLHAPLELVIVRKISHPYQLEYAVGGITENGQIVVNHDEVNSIDQEWFQQEAERQLQEAKRRRQKYTPGYRPPSLRNKTVILVDDGIATGFTIKAALAELRHYEPQKIVLAVPMAPKQIIEEIKLLVDELVILEIPEQFLGAVGAYYQNFPQVTDEEVISLLKSVNQK